MPSDREHTIAEVLSLLAHDLKNPLAAAVTNLGFVDGWVQDLDPGAVPTDEVSEVREAMLDARLACEALQRFVSNLEVLSRDLAHVAGGEPAPVDLHAIADEIVSRHVAAASARRVRLEVRGESAWALADRDPLLRAADNALANAIQHAPAGTAVLVEIGTEGSSVVLSFVDQGVVVPQALCDQAVSLEGQPKLKGRPEGRYGRGLALYAAAVAARRAGGQVTLGERNGASVITVVLTRYEDGV